MLEWISRDSTCGQPSTASLVGLRCWASYFCSGVPNTSPSKDASELHASSSRCNRSGCTRKDRSQSGETVIIHFRGSKTDQDGHGIVRSLNPRLCPVYGAVLLLQHAASIGLQPCDPICSTSQANVLRAEAMLKLIRSAATATRDAPKCFSCHSLRSGGATALLASGVDSTIVMMHGRWRSDVYQRYTRLTEKMSSSLSEYMVSVFRSHKENLLSSGVHASSARFTLNCEYTSLICPTERYFFA